MSNSEPELKSCPFCGGPAAIAPLVWTPGFHTVGCPTCRMWTRTTIDGRGRHGTREELINVWNRRTPPAHEDAAATLALAFEDLVAIAETTFDSFDLLDARIALDAWRESKETGGSTTE
jgi:hypothetical protein